MPLKILRNNPNHVAILDPKDSLDGTPIEEFDSATLEVWDRADDAPLAGAESIPMELGTALVKGVATPALIGTIPAGATAGLDLKRTLDLYATVELDGEVTLYKELVGKVAANSS